METDNVNNPSHYTKGGIECIDALIAAYGLLPAMYFCLGNAFKYQFRCLNKWNTEEDLKKAEWYNNKYIELKNRYYNRDCETVEKK